MLIHWNNLKLKRMTAYASISLSGQNHSTSFRLTVTFVRKGYSSPECSPQFRSLPVLLGAWRSVSWKYNHKLYMWAHTDIIGYIFPLTRGVGNVRGKIENVKNVTINNSISPKCAFASAAYPFGKGISLSVCQCDDVTHAHLHTHTHSYTSRWNEDDGLNWNDCTSVPSVG